MKNGNKKIEKSELSGECRVLSCADTGSEDPRWRAPVFIFFLSSEALTYLVDLGSCKFVFALITLG
jgi:hypothetical protein